MTEQAKTATEHLRAALTILDQQRVGPADLVRASTCIQQAVTVIQRLRCNAQASLDQL